MLDIFGATSPPVAFGTLADDVQCVSRHFKSVGDDLRVVLSEEFPSLDK